MTTTSAPPPSVATGPPARADGAAEALQLGRQAASAYGREDLAARLGSALTRVRDPHLQVLVVGEFKQGKSSLINALLRAPVCPVDDDVATAVPMAVRYGETPRAMVVPGGVDGADEEPAREIPVSELVAHVSESGNPGNRLGLARAEVALPREMLRTGLVLTDTPGVGGLGSAHSATTLGVLPDATAVVLVSDASQEYTRPELDFLATARELCPNVLCVLTKIDLHPEWRRILARCEQHLAAEGVAAPILATSATLREEALRLGDEQLHEESGYPALLGHLHDEVVGRASALTLRASGHDLASVSAQLAAMFAAERAALADPESAAATVAALEDAKTRADRLRSQLARWQQTLGDGFADLQSDCEHYLRDRTRVLGREAEEALDDEDPAEIWDQFEPWLQRRVTAEVADSYTRMTRGTRELADEVAAHFAEDGAAVTVALPSIATPTASLERIDLGERIEAAKVGIGEKGMTALRGSYGGVLMFGMLGGLAGMALLNPVSVAMGVKLGHKALKDERERQIAARRAEAKTASRRYIDEVSFQVGKDLRDTLRRIQRSLRDEFTARAEELQRSAAAALAAAQAAANQDQAQRQARLRDIDAELTRIDGLQQTAARLVAAADADAAAPTTAEGGRR